MAPSSIPCSSSATPMTPVPLEGSITSESLRWIRVDNHWYPAICFDNGYGQVLAKLHDDLEPKVQSAMAHACLKQAQEGGVDALRRPVARILGTNEFRQILDPSQQECNFFRHFAQIYKTPAQLQAEYGPQELKLFYQGMHQVNLLLAKENNTSPAPMPSFANTSTTTTSETTVSSNSSATAAPKASSNSGKRPPKLAQRQIDSKSQQQQQEQQVAVSNKRKATAANVISPSKKKKKTNNKSKQQHQLKAKSQRTTNNKKPDNFYVWPVVWDYLKEMGWLHIRAKNPLHDWWYLQPHVDPTTISTTAVLGVDYFCTPQDVIEFSKTKMQLKEKVGYKEESESEQESEEEEESESEQESDEDDDDKRMSEQSQDEESEEEEQDSDDDDIITTPNVKTVPRDPAKPHLSNDDQDESDSEHDSQERFKWNRLWPKLFKFGWKAVRAGKHNPLHSWYYVRPNKSVESGTLGVDYFASCKDVIRFEMKAEGLIDDDSDDDNEEELTRLRLKPRVSLSPAFAHATTMHHKKKKKKRTKQWWHEEAVPSYLQQVWPILRDTLDFRFGGGSYSLPAFVDCNKQQLFPTDKDLRAYLIENGVPNWDKLEKEEDKQVLERWLRFAHVPVKDVNSVIKLQDLDVLDNDTAMKLLQKLGMTQTNDGKYSMPNGAVCSTVGDVRVHVRQVASLQKEISGRRAARGGGGPVLDLDEMLDLRLWGATSAAPLPVWGGDDY